MKDSIDKAIDGLLEDEYQPELGLDPKSNRRNKRLDGVHQAAQELKVILQQKIKQYQEFEDGSIRVTVGSPTQIAIDVNWAPGYADEFDVDGEPFSWYIPWFSKKGFQDYNSNTWRVNAEDTADAFIAHARECAVSLEV